MKMKKMNARVHQVDVVGLGHQVGDVDEHGGDVVARLDEVGVEVAVEGQQPLPLLELALVLLLLGHVLVVPEPRRALGKQLVHLAARHVPHAEVGEAPQGVRQLVAAQRREAQLRHGPVEHHLRLDVPVLGLHHGMATHIITSERASERASQRRERERETIIRIYFFVIRE